MSSSCPEESSPRKPSKSPRIPRGRISPTLAGNPSKPIGQHQKVETPEVKNRKETGSHPDRRTQFSPENPSESPQKSLKTRNTRLVAQKSHAPLGKSSGTLRNIFGKYSETVGNPSEFARELVGNPLGQQLRKSRNRITNNIKKKRIITILNLQARTCEEPNAHSPLDSFLYNN